MESPNPFAPPESRIADGVPTPERFYTIAQIAVASFFGGALAGGYFIARNHALLGSPGMVRWTWFWSVLLMVAAFVVGFFLPGRFGTYFLGLAVFVAYRQYAKMTFGDRIAKCRAEGWRRYSWWMVVGITIAIFLVFVAIGAIGGLAYYWMMNRLPS